MKERKTQRKKEEGEREQKRKEEKEEDITSGLCFIFFPEFFN